MPILQVLQFYVDLRIHGQNYCLHIVSESPRLMREILAWGGIVSPEGKSISST